MDVKLQALPLMLKPKFYRILNILDFIPHFFHSLMQTLKKKLGISFPTSQTFRSLFFSFQGLWGRFVSPQVLRSFIGCACGDTWWKTSLSIVWVRFKNNIYYVNMCTICFIVDLCFISSGGLIVNVYRYISF